MASRYFLRTHSEEKLLQSIEELREFMLQEKCGAGDFVLVEGSDQWQALCELEELQDFFAQKPVVKPEKPIITVMDPTKGNIQTGPYNLSEVKYRIRNGLLGANSWIFIEGDKDWRQVSQVKLLREELPTAPNDSINFDQIQTEAFEGSDSTPSLDSIATEDNIFVEDKTQPDMNIASLQSEASAEVQRTPSFAPSVAAMSESAVTSEAAQSFAAAESSLAAEAPTSMPMATDSSTQDNVERISEEEQTKAFSALGLAAVQAEANTLRKAEASQMPPVPNSAPDSINSIDPPPLDNDSVASPPPPKMSPSVDGTATNTQMPVGNEDGMVVEVSNNAIWLLKVGEDVHGPYTFLQVSEMLDTDKINKDVKISKLGTNRYCKIRHQYEFNVDYSRELVLENGVQREKILIKRRHPRANYMAQAQYVKNGVAIPATCVNISAGGALLEVTDTNLELGEVVDLKIFPGMIDCAIACRALVIGKIAKKPPGLALQFTNLKPEVTAEISKFVMTTVQREQREGQAS